GQAALVGVAGLDVVVVAGVQLQVHALRRVGPVGDAPIDRIGDPGGADLAGDARQAGAVVGILALVLAEVVLLGADFACQGVARRLIGQRFCGGGAQLGEGLRSLQLGVAGVGPDGGEVGGGR